MTADLARLLLGAHELMNMIGNYVPPCTCLRVTVPHLFPAIFDTQIQMSRDGHRQTRASERRRVGNHAKLHGS